MPVANVSWCLCLGIQVQYAFAFVLHLLPVGELQRACLACPGWLSVHVC